MQDSPNGSVQIFDNCGDLEFDGTMKNGNREDLGKEYDKSILIYDGGFKDGYRHGKNCKVYDYSSANLVYEGEMKYDQREGKGK